MRPYSRGFFIVPLVGMGVRMGDVFSTLDIIVFLATLILVMGVGLWAGRKEESSEDYFLAGRGIHWWQVAGSIFGSNVSANHLVGMVGIGYAVGFAQSHFELGAIAGLMLLCYGFLPVYRKLQVFTLSEYLAQRYDERSRVLYAIAMVYIMVFVQMVPGFYIGSRSMNLLLGGTSLALGYKWGVVALAVVAGVYTILGGLKAVIWTDVLQSMLLLAAGILVAILTFGHDAIGGWSGMLALDAAGADKMHLYLPSDNPDLPWTGMFTGLMCLHFFYWGTNQFIVQRALAARSDGEARLGIVTAGFFKLLIPFFAIGTGIASYYLFDAVGANPDPDAAFPELVKIVVPLGYGLVGVIAAGLIGAILSSIDSMMNSSATIVTMDIYRRYINPSADNRQLIRIGQLSIVVFVAVGALMAITVLDPDSDDNFFLVIVDQQSHVVPGLLVAFAVGMAWRGATATGAFVTILLSPFLSYGFDWAYDARLHEIPWLNERFGDQLNTFHRVAVIVPVAILLHVVISLASRWDAEKAKLTWSELGAHRPQDVRWLLGIFAASFALLIALAVAMVTGRLAPPVCATVGGLWTFGMFCVAGIRVIGKRFANDEALMGESYTKALLTEDRFYAGILCGLTVFMLFFYY